MKTITRQMKWCAVPLLLAATLAACGDSADETGTTTADTAQMVVESMQGEREKGYNPENAEFFEEMVYKEFAHNAVNVPKSVMDSIMQSAGDPMKGIEKMNVYMKGIDSAARAQLAAKYDIPVDSLTAILTRQSKKRNNDGAEEGKK